MSSDHEAGERARELLTARVDDRDLAAAIAVRIATEIVGDVDAIAELLTAQTTLPAVLVALVCDRSGKSPTDLLAEVYALLAGGGLSV